MKKAGFVIHGQQHQGSHIGKKTHCPQCGRKTLTKHGHCESCGKLKGN